MAEKIKAPRGTQDVLPQESWGWQEVRRITLDTASKFGFSQVTFPTFEHTELFLRGVGDTTDVVAKEMYTFEDKGGRSITLRPEGTASAVRMAIERGLCAQALPVKVDYVVPCFRYEKPQAGRLREFHQFGVECFGSPLPSADAELISLGAEVMSNLGIDSYAIEINSIGCPECRREYYKALKEYFGAHLGELCETCRSRFDKNPMRILDCKSPVCGEIAASAPLICDYLCEECSGHFKAVKTRLDLMGIKYTVNPRIVRGLDYYTKTVFEFVTLDTKSVILGGGRYDGLFEELGGASTPALGFAMGIERVILTLQGRGLSFGEKPGVDLFLASVGDRAALFCEKKCLELRREGFNCECDIMGRSLKAQMKYANKLGAALTAVIGEGELEQGIVSIKNMTNGELSEVRFDDMVEQMYVLRASTMLGDSVLKDL